MELLQALASFIKQSGKKRFYKSDFRHAPTNINPDSAFEALKEAEFCQTHMPRIRVIEMEEGRNVIIEVLEETSE
ncbi:MAG: hypothetical protein ACFE9L_16120 [Candidatus Hodarchaeota archaeon]